MSYEAVRWALYDAPMILTAAGKPDTTARMVLIARAERADKHGKNTYAGPADLMKTLGFDERTIQRADRRLEAAGLMARDGWSHVQTVRWRLAMSVKRSDTEKAAPDPRVEARRKADALRQQRARDRRKAPESAPNSPGDIEGDGVFDDAPETPVTDSASVTSRTLNPDVTDSASGRHGRNAPQTTSRTTHEPPGLTTLGGTLPPSPLRHPSASLRGTENFGALAIAPTPAQDQQGESLPQAHAIAAVREIRPGASLERPHWMPPPRSPDADLAVAEARLAIANARRAHRGVS